MSAFYSETIVKSVRKPKPCDGCSRVIKVGERAIRWVGNEDGFQTALFHPECRRAEIKLNDLHGTRQYWNDWVRLAEIEWGDWPWLIAECPLVAVYMGTTMVKYEANRSKQERVRQAWSAIDAARKKVPADHQGSRT